MNRAIATIWSGMLVATVVAVVPAAVTLLSRALNAARQIEKYTADALAGGVKVAGNTANVAALKDTISVAPLLLGAAGSLEKHTAAIANALAPAAIDVVPDLAPIPSTDPPKRASRNGKSNGHAAGEEGLT